MLLQTTGKKWLLCLLAIFCASISFNCSGGGGSTSSLFDPEDEEDPEDVGGEDEEEAGPMSTALRTSGVAPFAVFFDAVENSTGLTTPPTEDSRSLYSQLHYQWNFGDSSAGTWSISGREKNEAVGFVAGHVFETPGTYTVQLKITDEDGEARFYEQDIEVTDPDDVYESPSGVTYYVSSSSGSNSNNGLSSSSPFQTFDFAVSTLFASNGPRRLLLRRGDSFTTAGLSTFNNKTGPYTIGMYGSSGAKPIVSISSAGQQVFAFGASSTDVRIVDIDFVGTGDQNEILFRPGTNMLLLRSSVSDFGSGVSTSSAHGNKPGNFIVDCEFENIVNYDIYYNFGQNVAIMGNTLNQVQDEHLIRSYITHSLIEHNHFTGGRASKHQLKFKGYYPTGDSNRDADTPTETVEYSIISDNLFEQPGPVDWVLAVGPVDASKDQRVDNCVIERNYFKAGSGTQVFVILWARYMTVRNNIFDATGADDSVSAISLQQRGIEPPPLGNEIYHNTAFRTDGNSSQTLVVVSGSSDASETTAINNLGACSNGQAISYSGQTLTSQGNSFSTSINSVLTNPQDGTLLSSSAALNLQVSTPIEVKEDYFGNLRDPDTCTAGAHEFFPADE